MTLIPTSSKKRNAVLYFLAQELSNNRQRSERLGEGEIEEMRGMRILIHLPVIENRPLGEKSCCASLIKRFLPAVEMTIYKRTPKSLSHQLPLSVISPSP
jgi:hypothetical protein